MVGNTINKEELQEELMQEDESDITVLSKNTLDDSFNKSGGKKGTRRKRKSGM